MNWFFSRDKPEATQPPPSQVARQSMFSTDVLDIAQKNNADILARSFPRFAMDSIKSDYGGAGVPVAQTDWYASQSFPGYQLLALLAQHWLISKCCWMPAHDAIRKGWEITINGGEKADPSLLARIKSEDKRRGITKQLIHAAGFARVFGIRVVMFKIDSADPEFYEKPFNPDGVAIGSYRGIVQLDPYWVSPMLDDVSSSTPDSLHFYEPTFWIINGRPVHRTHLVIIRPDPVADILKPSYLYGGLSVPQKVYERVYAAERTANEAPQLAMTKRTDIFYTDTSKALANQSKFEAGIAWWRSMMDNYGIKIADKEADRLERFDTSLSDLDTVIMTQFQLVAATANVPATKLLGTQPKGFNSSGDYEESSYHEELENIHAQLMPMIDRHYMLLEKSLGLSLNICASFEELDAMTTKERAEVNLLNAQAAALHVQNGAIDGMDERSRLTTDPDSGYNGMADVEAPTDEHI